MPEQPERPAATDEALTAVRTLARLRRLPLDEPDLALTAERLAEVAKRNGLDRGLFPYPESAIEPLTAARWLQKARKRI